jgi:hypothetical protein
MIGYIFIDALGSSLHVAMQPSYFAVVGSALAGAALAIYAVLPMLDTITRPEENHTE